jgi:hypothetical protein
MRFRAVFQMQENYKIVQLSDLSEYYLSANARLIVNDSLSPSKRPSNMFLGLHFQQVLLCYVFGQRGYNWRGPTAYSMASAFLYDGHVNLARPCWTIGLGKELLERYSAMELYRCLPAVLDDTDEHAFWGPERKLKHERLVATPAQAHWPKTFAPPFQGPSTEPSMEMEAQAAGTFSAIDDWDSMEIEGIDESGTGDDPGSDEESPSPPGVPDSGFLEWERVRVSIYRSRFGM